MWELRDQGYFEYFVQSRYDKLRISCVLSTVVNSVLVLFQVGVTSSEYNDLRNVLAGVTTGEGLGYFRGARENWGMRIGWVDAVRLEHKFCVYSEVLKGKDDRYWACLSTLFKSKYCCTWFHKVWIWDWYSRYADIWALKVVYNSCYSYSLVYQPF